MSEPFISGCAQCVCYGCKWHWDDSHKPCPKSGAECFDDFRAIENPFPKGEKRPFWSRQDEPGEQDHWCRGGITYPVTECDKWEPPADEVGIQPCIKASLICYSDGIKWCPLVEPVGCEWCYEQLMGSEE